MQGQAGGQGDLQQAAGAGGEGAVDVAALVAQQPRADVGRRAQVQAPPGDRKELRLEGESSRASNAQMRFSACPRRRVAEFASTDEALARILEPFGPVQGFDYPYMLAGRKRPDALPQLIAAHRAALESMAGETGKGVVLAGKSMGGRVGCHLALQAPSRR